MIAGTVYAVVVLLVLVLIPLPSFKFAATRSITFFVLFEFVVGIIGVVIVVALGACVALAIVSFGSMVAMTIFNLTLGYAIPPLVAGGLIGGVSGFISTCWVFAAINHESWRASLPIFLGPIMATVVCHFGAYCQVRKCQFLLAADDLADETLTGEKLLTAIKRFEKSDSPFLDEPRALALSQAPSVHPLDEPDDVPPEQPSPRVELPRNRSHGRLGRQWSLRQGFVLTAWCGVLAAIGAASPAFGSVAMSLFGIYGSIQLVSFGVVHIAQKPIDRRLSRVTLQLEESLRELEDQRTR